MIKIIRNVFITQEALAQGGGNVLCPGGPANGLVPCEAWTPQDILNFFISLRDFLLAIGAILIIIFLVIAGIKFITARGDERKVEEGKKMLQWGIIGAFIILAVFIILQTIIRILRDRGLRIF